MIDRPLKNFGRYAHDEHHFLVTSIIAAPCNILYIFPIPLVFSYNTMKDQWTELPKLSKERGYHGICGVGSNVYIAGGYSCVNSETLNSGIVLLFI